MRATSVPSAGWLSVASKRSSVSSSAPARSRSAAVPTAHSPSPPAKRRWLLRALRASADSRPVSRPNSVTIRSASPVLTARSTMAEVEIADKAWAF